MLISGQAASGPMLHCLQQAAILQMMKLNSKEMKFLAKIMSYQAIELGFDLKSLGSFSNAFVFILS